jgi:polyferredoxin
MVDAIHPEGNINDNECMQCLHCQVLYKDQHKCPAKIKEVKRDLRHKEMREKKKQQIKLQPQSLGYLFSQLNILNLAGIASTAPSGHKYLQ